MNTNQLNKLAMYRAVEATLVQAPEPAGNPAFVASLAAFVGALDEIEALAVVQARPLAATIAERDAAIEAAVDATLALAGIASSYADENGLKPLAIHIRVRHYEFQRARIDQRVRMTQQIYDAIAPFAPQLAELGVTPSMLEDVQAKIEAAVALIPATRGTTVDKKVATAQLLEAFRAVDAILANRLDPLLLPLRKTEPHFYARYRTAREVVTRGGGRTPAESTSEQQPGIAPTAKALPFSPEQLAA